MFPGILLNPGCTWLIMRLYISGTDLQTLWYLASQISTIIKIDSRGLHVATATVFHSIVLHDLILMSIFEATSTVSYATSLDLTIFEPM